MSTPMIMIWLALELMTRLADRRRLGNAVGVRCERPGPAGPITGW